LTADGWLILKSLAIQDHTLTLDNLKVGHLTLPESQLSIFLNGQKYLKCPYTLRVE
jgi:hypothetical protein